MYEVIVAVTLKASDESFSCDIIRIRFHDFLFSERFLFGLSTFQNRSL